MAVRGLGCPVNFTLTAGQKGDAPQAGALIQGLPAKVVMADTAYDADHLRQAICDAWTKDPSIFKINPRHLMPVRRSPWNIGRIIGPKPPFKPKHVWGIRQQLKAKGRVRDLAMFNCAIVAKLRGCDLVRLRVSDVTLGSSLRARATVIQQKTGQPVPFEITEPTRDALAVWLKVRGRRHDDWLFPSRSRPGDHVSTRQYA